MVCHRSGECWNVVNWPLGTNFSEILLDMYTFSFRKTHLKMPSGKWHFVSAPMYWVLVYSQGVRTSSVSPVWPLVAQIAKFMEPTWGPPGSCRPQMGPMLAPWTLLSGRPSSGTMLATELHIFLPRFSGFLWSLVIFVDVIQNGWRDLKTYRSTSNVLIYIHFFQRKECPIQAWLCLCWCCWSCMCRHRETVDTIKEVMHAVNQAVDQWE